MSRKPMAIKLDDGAAKNKERPDTKQSKPKSKNASSIKKQPKTTKPKIAKRAPRVMSAPKADSNQSDPFDQSPFTDTTIETSTHLPDLNKGLRWGSILIGSLGFLLTLGISFWLYELIERFFKTHIALGWITAGLIALAAIALIALLVKEFVSISRLRKLETLRQDAESVLLTDKPASETLNALTNLYSSRKDMRWHLEQLKSFDQEIIDNADRMRLAEKTLMEPLDAEAKQIIAATAKRVSVITALNPSAILDILFVGYQVLNMLRKLMALYGGKPAFFGAVKLIKLVATHIAITGGLALSDTLLQQFVGKGLAGRLSTKIGEGTVNGIMVTRIGLAAIDLCRPLPFDELERPNLKAFVSELMKNSWK